MRGFFDKAQTQSLHMSERGPLSCVSCGLYANVTSPRIRPYGEFKKKIMVIGEGPGATEDARGAPWQGSAGQYLQETYASLGVNLFEDCISMNAVNCRPTDPKGRNRAPTPHEIDCCRPQVLRAIEKYAPRVIILHGGPAAMSLLSPRSRKDFGGITKWQGWAIPDREIGAWVCPTFHPSYVLRQLEVSPEVEVIWKKDLRQAFSSLNVPVPVFPALDEAVTVATTEDDGDDIVAMLLKDAKPMLAFDIEGTGLKPYDKESHRILTISFCADLKRAYAIPMPTRPRGLRRLKRLLEHPQIGKIAANMKFENTWFSVLHDIHVRPWVFDTMQAAHILDNRPGINSLKFQAFVRFGVAGYDDAIAQYIKSPGANTVNRLPELIKTEAGLRTLLLYNGADSLCTFWLAQVQMRELGLL